MVRGWSDVYVCGIDTEVCVLKTAVDAFERDIVPWLVMDASASHSGVEAHEAGLLVAQKMLGRRQLISAANVIEAL
jgi:nicotinamidase-related amidase